MKRRLHIRGQALNFLTATVRKPKASKYHCVTSWGLLMLQLLFFSKKSSGALNTGQLSAAAPSHIFGGESEIRHKPSVDILGNSNMHHLKSMDVAYLARPS